MKPEPTKEDQLTLARAINDDNSSKMWETKRGKNRIKHFVILVFLTRPVLRSLTRRYLSPWKGFPCRTVIFKVPLLTWISGGCGLKRWPSLGLKSTIILAVAVACCNAPSFTILNVTLVELHGSALHSFPLQISGVPQTNKRFLYPRERRIV